MILDIFFLDHNIKCDVFETYPYKLLPVNHGSQQSAGFTAAGVSTCCYKDAIREYSWQHLANSHLCVYAKQTNSSHCSVFNVSPQNCQLSVPIFLWLEPFWSHGWSRQVWPAYNPVAQYKYLFQKIFILGVFCCIFLNSFVFFLIIWQARITEPNRTKENSDVWGLILNI